MAVLLAAHITLINWLRAHLLSCPYKKYLHVDCPGCGFQRSVLALFEGHWQESLGLYPATPLILALVPFLLLHLKFKFATGATIIKYSYLAIAIVIAIFYIYKIINHKIIA